MDEKKQRSRVPADPGYGAVVDIDLRRYRLNPMESTRIIIALFSLMTVLFSSSPAARAERSWVPAPLDRNVALIERYWTWLLEETGAPHDLEKPEIVIAALPRNVRMALQFPSPMTPEYPLRIIVSQRSIDRAATTDQLVVIGELAHELAHYVLLLAENGWDTRRSVLRNEVHHHCDRTFMRLSGHIGEILWQAYHSNDALRAIDQMVQSSCWRDGHRLGLAASN